MVDSKLSILDSKSNVPYESNEVSAIETPDIGIPEALNDKYIYLEKLGKGSQGQVWLAQRKSDGERVAIKQLNVHSVTTWKQYELFKREAKILESLNIDGVVPFYEYIEELEAKPPFVCIIQKFIEGQTLGEMLKAKHRFETEAIYDIIAQVLGILQKLHTHEPPVVHRDIKPSNLMLTPLENGRYQVTLLDFGAVANPQVQNGGSTVAGTYGYMPPEQLMGQAQPASDIYALAALAVEMLSGTSPADIAVCDFKLVIEPYLQHLPKEVVQTLSMMLEPAVENRVCDHTALMAQFDALANKKEPSLLKFLRRTAVPKLEDVESICQPGNYEIWQNLDQSSDIEFESCPCHLDVKLAEHEQKNLDSARFSLCFILFTVAMLIVMSLFATGHPIAGMTTMGLSVPISIFLAYYAKPLTTRTALDCQGVSPVPKVSALTWKEIHQLLNQGQKVVGQISAIYYQNIDEKYDLYFKENRKQEELIAYDFPKFWVIYRFKFQGEYPFEFYGELLTYTSPEGHYKIGDPITLVADIFPTKQDRMRLSVVPYPYPFGDVWQKDNIVYTCDFNKASLMNGDVLACEKQLKLHCLSSLQFTHHSLGGDSPSSLFASKYGPISNAEQDHALFHSVNFEHQNIAFAETSTRKVEVYPHRYLDFESSCVFYRLLAEQYLKRFEFTAEELVSRASYVDKAACIYKTMLNDEETARELYWQLADKYIDEYVAGNDEYFEIAEELYQEKLYVKSPSCVDMEKTTDYRFYASIVDRLIPKVSMGEYRYIKVLDVIYRDYLKFSHEADKIRKMQRLLELSEKGNADACMELGNIYRDVFFNEALSNVFYHRAAEQYLKNYKRDDDVDACLDAAALFEKLLGKEISSVFYQRAVEIHLEYFKHYDDVDACLDAAAIYKKNLGDEEAARKLYEKAVDYHLKKFKRYHIRQSCLDAVNIYKKYLVGDDEAANNLYYELIVLDLKTFQKSGDIHVLQRAANLYVCELKNKKSRCEMHEKIANICIELLDLTNDEIIQFLLEIADVLKNEFLNTEAAFNLYRKLADAYIERFAFTDDSFYIHRAIKIYKDKLPESMEIDVLYRKLADSYIKNFECSGDFMFIHSAVNIYKNKLSDDRGMQETYKKMLNYCMQKFDETGDEEFIHKVMPICRLIIKDLNAERDLWLKLIGLRLKSGDEASMMDAAKIYRYHLKDVDSANKVYKQIIDKLLNQAHSDDEVIFKVAKIYKDNLNDRASADQLLRSLVEKYLKLYESGSIEALQKAADICRKKLYDVSLTRKLYTQLAEQYLNDWDEGNLEALEKAAKIYRDILYDRNSAYKLYTQLAEQYLNDWKQSKRKFSKENENIEALVKAAEIYKTDLKDPDTAAELYQLLETAS